MEACTLIVLVVAARLLFSAYRVLYPYFFATPIDLHVKAGAKWAAVTGATDGIGKAYAFELAEKNFNLFLVSRTQSKLEATKKEINDRFPKIEIKTFSFNFLAATSAEYEPLVSALKTIEVGVLINNVGMAVDCPEILHEVAGGRTEIGQIHTCNTMSVLMLCHAVLEQMSVRRSGIIVNVASAAALGHMSFWNVYAATKRYVVHLSHILRLEYAPYNVTVQCLTPMGVSTKMLIMDTPKLFAPSATDYAHQAIKTIGIVHETTGYYIHQIQAEVFHLLPDCILDKLIYAFNKNLRAQIKQKSK